MDIVFGMVRAARDENLVLHIQSIYAMIPWVFAYDAVSYAQYLPYCTVTMSKRVERHPGLFVKFLLIEPDKNCQSWCLNCWWNKGVQLETSSSDKIWILFSYCCNKDFDFLWSRTQHTEVFWWLLSRYTDSCNGILQRIINCIRPCWVAKFVWW